MNSIEESFNSLRDRLMEGEWRAGERLPSLAHLAKECAVSRTTMWRALGRLQRENLVHVRHRGAIIAGQPDRTAPPLARPHYTWDHIRQRIGSDALLGAATKGPLPPICKLALRYGVAVDTARKAVDALVREGVLIREGRRIRQANNPLKQKSASVVLIASGSAGKGISIGETRTEKVVASFERECARLGLAPRCEGFDPTNPAALIEMGAALEAMPPLAGVIVNFWEPWDATLLGRWIDLLNHLLKQQVPVILLDQAGTTEFPFSLTENRHLRVFRIAGSVAGEQVADALLAKGHRHVVYLTPFENMPWSKARARGLIRRLERYGQSRCSVTISGRTDTVDTHDLVLAALRLTPANIKKLYRERLSERDRTDLSLRSTKANVRELAQMLAAGVSAGTIHEFAAFMIRLIDRPHDQRLYDELLEFLVHIASNTAGFSYLRPLFQRALRATKATVWICSDDKTGIRAVEFLRERGRRVPEDVAVCGFENWREAYEHQLSTYDFNMSGMVQQALLLIMDEKRMKASPAIGEIEGYVVERTTTRAA